MATDFGFKLNLNFKAPEAPALPVIDDSKPLLDPEIFKRIEKDELTIAREAHEQRNWLISKRKPLQITDYIVGKVRIVYDGVNYEAHLLKPMLQNGFAYWKTLYEKEIAFARAMCYAQHLIKYGNFGQVCPPKATEYLTISEVKALEMEKAIAAKNAISWDNIPKPDKTLTDGNEKG